MKLSISLNERLVGLLDEFAVSNGLSRSGAISIALTSYLNSKETVAAMKGLTDKLQELVANGVPATEEEISQLDAIGKVIGMMK